LSRGFWPEAKCLFLCSTPSPQVSLVMPPTSANWWLNGRARIATATSSFTLKSSWTQRRGSRSTSPWTTDAASSRTWMGPWVSSPRGRGGRLEGGGRRWSLRWEGGRR
uniref:Uncharacterized protein n=1 Tax=Castor canadensis TaxID=51338 RepID=A0A8C0X365_CASCN